MAESTEHASFVRRRKLCLQRDESESPILFDPTVPGVNAIPVSASYGDPSEGHHQAITVWSIVCSTAASSQSLRTDPLLA